MSTMSTMSAAERKTYAQWVASHRKVREVTCALPGCDHTYASRDGCLGRTFTFRGRRKYCCAAHGLKASRSRRTRARLTQNQSKE